MDKEKEDRKNRDNSGSEGDQKGRHESDKEKKPDQDRGMSDDTDSEYDL